jgi:type I restriction enzyme S subunit
LPSWKPNASARTYRPRSTRPNAIQRASGFETGADAIGGAWGPYHVPFVFSTNGRPYLKPLETESGNQPALNKDKVQRLPIPLAPPDEAKAVAQAIEANLEPLHRIELELSSARKQLDHLEERLLVEAFSGELVPQDTSDEPASVLLARIRNERAGSKQPRRSRGGRRGDRP